MVLSTKEPRIIQDASDLRSKVRVLTTHQAWLKSGNYQQLCTALGAGNDAYELAKKLPKKICAVPVANLSLLVTTSLGIVRTGRSQKTFPVQSPSQPWCLVCVKFVSPTTMPSSSSFGHVASCTCRAVGAPVPDLDQQIHSAEAVQPIRSVLPFHILSGVVLPGAPLHPGVSEQVLICHVLHLACGKKFLFSLLIPCYISFPPMVSESFLESSRSEIPPNLWHQLKSLADTKANSLAHREFQHIKAFCQWVWQCGQMVPSGMETPNCKSFRLLNKTCKLHSLYVVVVIQRVSLGSFDIAWSLDATALSAETAAANYLTYKHRLLQKQAHTHTDTQSFQVQASIGPWHSLRPPRWKLGISESAKSREFGSPRFPGSSFFSSFWWDSVFWLRKTKQRCWTQKTGGKLGFVL